MTVSMYADFDHAMRGPLAVILGEAELVLSHGDVSAEERRRSVENVIGAVHQMEHLLVQWRAGVEDPTQ